MHHYPFHIGDFRKDTFHLNFQDRAIYREILDWYYLDEKPIPNDVKYISKKIGLNGEFQVEINDILNEFFELKETGWHSKRADNEIKKYHRLAEIARANGKKGGKKTTNNIKHLNPVGTQPFAIQKLTKNQEPRTKSIGNQYTAAPHTLGVADKDGSVS